ncbi:MAG TPA: DUF559 domain-containing protein, partial [Actinomycetota bacterium]|nr:DUF559 domain-containing protein [Actinomycetota bacterium]
PLVITSTKRGLSVPALKVYRRVPDPRFVGMFAGIPVTNPSLTLMNLAEVEKDPVRYENALDDALRTGLVSPMQLRWGIERLLGPGRRGVGRLARLLEERGPGGPSASGFQKDVRVLLAPEGDFIEEYEVRDERGRLAGVVDFALPPPKVIVEADGLEHHGSRQDFRHDANRRNRIHALGWVMLSITPDDLADPGPFLRHLRATIARRTAR